MEKYFVIVWPILDQQSQIWFAYDDAENLESKIGAKMDLSLLTILFLT